MFFSIKQSCRILVYCFVEFVFTLPKMVSNAIYIFDSDLVWRMQLMIIKVKNSCCVCREFVMLIN